MNSQSILFNTPCLAGRELLYLADAIMRGHAASELGREIGGRDPQCPVAESISDQLVRLPFFKDRTESEQGAVHDLGLSFRICVIAPLAISA